MPGTRPTKAELARFQAMADSGLSANAIGQQTGRDPKTVRAYLKSDAYLDPDVKELVKQIKEVELQDLHVLIAKARARLHELLDQGELAAIPALAIADRCFQQRRLLEGASTENFAHASLIEQLAADRKQLLEKLKMLDSSETHNG